MIADSIGIEIEQKPIEETPIPKERTEFPYDVFLMLFKIILRLTRYKTNISAVLCFPLYQPQ